MSRVKQPDLSAIADNDARELSIAAKNLSASTELQQTNELNISIRDEFTKIIQEAYNSGAFAEKNPDWEQLESVVKKKLEAKGYYKGHVIEALQLNAQGLTGLLKELGDNIDVTTPLEKQREIFQNRLAALENRLEEHFTPVVESGIGQLQEIARIYANEIARINPKEFKKSLEL